MAEDVEGSCHTRCGSIPSFFIRETGRTIDAHAGRAVQDHLQTDQSERQGGCESFGVVEVLVARQASVDRLSQQIGHDDLGKTEGYVRLPCPIGFYWSGEYQIVAMKSSTQPANRDV